MFDNSKLNTTTTTRGGSSSYDAASTTSTSAAGGSGSSSAPPPPTTTAAATTTMRRRPIMTIFISVVLMFVLAFIWHLGHTAVESNDSGVVISTTLLESKTFGLFGSGGGGEGDGSSVASDVGSSSKSEVATDKLAESSERDHRTEGGSNNNGIIINGRHPSSSSSSANIGSGSGSNIAKRMRSGRTSGFMNPNKPFELFDALDYIDLGVDADGVPEDGNGAGSISAGGAGGSVSSSDGHVGGGSSIGSPPRKLCDITALRGGAAADQTSVSSSSGKPFYNANWRLRPDFDAAAFCARFPAQGVVRSSKTPDIVTHTKGAVLALHHPPEWGMRVHDDDEAAAATPSSTGGHIVSSTADEEVLEQYAVGKMLPRTARHNFSSSGTRGSSSSARSARSPPLSYIPLKARKTPARIYYGMMFGAEFDMLELALHEVYPIVDKIVLIESAISHSLKPKQTILSRVVTDPAMRPRYERFFRNSTMAHLYGDGSGAANGGDSDSSKNDKSVPKKINTYIFKTSKKFRSGWDIEKRQRNLFMNVVKDLGIRDGDIAMANMDLDEVLSATALLKLKYCEPEVMIPTVVVGGGGAGASSSSLVQHGNQQQEQQQQQRSYPAQSTSFNIVHFRYHFGCMAELTATHMTGTLFEWKDSVRSWLNLYVMRKAQKHLEMPAMIGAVGRRFVGLIGGSLDGSGSGTSSSREDGVVGGGDGGVGTSSSSSAEDAVAGGAATSTQRLDKSYLLRLPNAASNERYYDPRALIYDVINGNTRNGEEVMKTAGTPQQFGGYVSRMREGLRREQEEEGSGAGGGSKQGKLAITSSSSSSSATAIDVSTTINSSAAASAQLVQEAINRDINAMQGFLVWHMSTFGGTEMLHFKRANSPHRFVDDSHGSPEKLREVIRECLFNERYRARVLLWAQNVPLLMRTRRGGCEWGRPQFQ